MVDGSRGGRRKALAWILLMAGLAGAGALVIVFGADEVLGAVRRVGWGIAVVCAWRVVPLLASTLAWRALIPLPGRIRLAALGFQRWIAESANNLLPLLQVGGDIVRARLALRRGVPADQAAASVVGDITAGLVTQVIFAIVGLSLIVSRGNGSGRVLLGLGGGILVLVAILAGFAWFQRSRFFGKVTERLLGMMGARESAPEERAALERAIDRLYADRRAFIVACAFRLAAWTLGAFEVWIALRFMGMEAGPGEALVLESLGQAARTAGFLIPGALGVQEGGLVLLGSLVGLSPETSLALSLVKRAREIVTGVPGLAAWQIEEARLRSLSARAPASGPDARSPRPTRA
jgi:putative membrane protein